MQKKSLCLLYFLFHLFTHSITRAQNDSLSTSKVQWETYGDLYFAYDINDPPGQKVVHTLTHPTYHNQFSLSLIYIKANFEQLRWRATVALATGTYMETNYAAEPQWARSILEAHAGLQLSNQWWLDMGILPSFIGFESPISADNALYSRSFVAELTPYYETGLRFTFTPHEHWQMKISILNGWQHIVDNNTDKALSIQVQYRPKQELTFSYASFYGNEGVQKAALWWVHNPFVYYKKNRWKLLLEALMSIVTNPMQPTLAWAMNLTGDYYLSRRWRMNARIEHIEDKNEIFYSTNTPLGFVNTSCALGATYFPCQGLQCRIEGRPFYSKDKIYLKSNNKTTNQSLLLSAGISWRF